MKTAPLILTLKIDAQSFEFFDAMRREYFPPERNFLSAHVTLFHHLPGENLENTRREIQRICAETAVFSLHFTRWRFLGKGTAMTIESPELLSLRNSLAKVWSKDLTPQDGQKFQPHITVQNKVAPDQARRTFETLTANFEPRSGLAKGLTLWHYAGGAWKFEAEYMFVE